MGELPDAVPEVELTEVGPDKTRVAIVRPRGFDKTLKYPVLDAAYAGPTTTVVHANALAYAMHQWMADTTGAVVVAIDAKGTPLRGRAWERALHKRIAEVPLLGHVEALEALVAKYAELDRARIGVYGWSFGGYFSAYATLARPDVYRAGMAGAPVVDQRDYDTAYTERYLGLTAPLGRDDAAYEAASVLSLVRPSGEETSSLTTRHSGPLTVAPPRPGKLFIVHGTADDNVYFLNSLKLVDALDRAGMDYEFMPVIGATHMVTDPAIFERVWARAASFLRAELAASSPAAGPSVPSVAP